MEERRCPKCGCTEIGRGTFGGNSKLFPANAVFTLGSQVLARVCNRCGYILELKVTNPEKFIP